MRLEILGRELRQAARPLRVAPGFVAAVSVTLALGVGATTALFSLVDALLLRPLPVRAPEQLVGLYSLSTEGHASFSFPDFEDYRGARDVFAELAAHFRLPLSVTLDDESERLWGEAVSATYFELLGPEMSLGRGLASGGEHTPEVVLGHALWRRLWGGRPEVLGRSIQIGGSPFTVVGIAGPAFRGTGLELGMGSRTELWLPMRYLHSVSPVWGSGLERRDARRFDVTGRLAPGISRARAASAVRLIAGRLASQYPATNRGLSALVVPGGSGRVSPETHRTVGSFLQALGAGVAFLLLAACVNVAHLQLARGLARSGEMAVRAALGAGTGRLASQLMTECILLSLAGLALSLPVAVATQRLLVRFSLPSASPLDLDVRLDLRVLLFAAALTLLTTVAFGLLPALRTARPDLRAALHGRSTAGGDRRSHSGQVLVGLQLALCLGLLVGAGLFVRSLGRAARIDLGFRVDHVLLSSVDFNADRHRFDETRAQRFYVEALERVRAVPGVLAASWAGDVPLGPRKIIIGFYPEPRDSVGEQEWQTLFCDVVSPGYFQTLGISLRGRDFRVEDDRTKPEVAVINEAMARRYWPDPDAIGRHFKVRGRTGVKTVEVVGVAADVKQRSLRDTPLPRLYLSLLQRHFPEMTLHVRIDGEPRELVPRIRAELAAVEPSLPVFGARLLRDQLDAELSPARTGAALLGASAFITLVLAAVGVYGVAARMAAQRQREMGIRLALGARPGQVLGLLLRQGLVSVAAGLVLGTAAALAFGRGLHAFLLDVPATDGVTYAASGVLLALVAGVALFVPARRLAALEPLVVLRHE